MKNRKQALAAGALVVSILVGVPVMNANSFTSAATNPAIEEGRTMVSDGEVDLAAVPALAFYGTFYLQATGWQQVGWLTRQAGLSSLARSAWDGNIWASGSDYLQHGGEILNPEIIFDR